MNFIDIFVNISILILIHVIFYKIESITSTKKLAIFLKNLTRIFHYPLIIYFSIYIASHKDNLLILYFGPDILYYIIKIKMFSKHICILLIILNCIQIIYEIIINRKDDIKKKDKIYAARTIINITKIFIIVILATIILSIFDIKPISLFLTIGTPLTLLSILLKNSIEDILFGIYLMISKVYKRGDRICIVDKNIEGYIVNFGLRVIEIKTLDNNIVYMRNFTFLNSLVVNKQGINNNINFSIEVKYQGVYNIEEIINNLKERVSSSSYFYQNLKYSLKEVKANIFKMDINLEIKPEKINKEDLINIELEFIKILSEVIIDNKCSLEILNKTTKQ